MISDPYELFVGEATLSVTNWFAVSPGGANVVGVGEAGWVFVAPDSGPRVVVDGEHLRVISPASPLGQAMADLEAGDAFEVNSPQGLAHYTVVALH